MDNLSTKEWAELCFGDAKLGDSRRTKRLVKLAEDMADGADKSIVNACLQPEKIEAAYRFFRNEKITTPDIAESGFLKTTALIDSSPLVLAIQDTTGLTYRHSVCDELGSVNCASDSAKSAKARTLYAHSTLIVDAQDEHVIGLADQIYWHREEKIKDSEKENKKRSYKEKESHRWVTALENVEKRKGDLNNVINVCDREADVYEYMSIQKELGNRFVIRAKEKRLLKGEDKNVQELVNATSGKCDYIVNVDQRSGRKARQAKMTVSFKTVTLAKPQRSEGKENLKVNIIICKEMDATAKQPLCWILYTTESIERIEDAMKIIRYYEIRWKIEVFHKIWKTDGANVEGVRMQTREALMRIAIIKAFIAVRLFQLKELVENQEIAKEIKCTSYVDDISWKLLWLKLEGEKEIPKEVPSLFWLYYSIAKLGRWHDSKRTGRVGMKALWSGWLALAEMVESAKLAKKLFGL